MIDDRARRGTLWMAFWGGAIAWLVHLLLLYGFSEFGCLGPWRGWRLGGVSATAWALLATTLLTAGLAGLAGWASWRLWRGQAVAAHMALILNATFFGIILYQAIPIFYFLGDCGGPP